MVARTTTTELEFRAGAIERIVVADFLDEDMDCVDVVVDELRRDPSRTDAEIARAVAQLILQP